MMDYDDNPPWSPVNLSKSSCFAPRFNYIEEFEDGTSFIGSSTGRGHFEDLQQNKPQGNASFLVHKSRPQRQLHVQILSDAMLRSFEEVIDPLEFACHSQGPVVLSFESLSRNYVALKQYLLQKEQLKGDNDGTVQELRLFVQDFMLDKAIFESFGFEESYDEGVLCASHFQDMQSWTLERDLDDIDEGFMTFADEIATDDNIITEYRTDDQSQNNSCPMQTSSTAKTIEKSNDHEWKLIEPRTDCSYYYYYPIEFLISGETIITLEHAFKHGDINSIKITLDAETSGIPQYLVIAALKSHNADIFECILAHRAKSSGYPGNLTSFGADVDKNLLKYTVTNGLSKQTESLLKHGARLEATFWFRMYLNAIELAGARGYYEAFQILLDNGRPGIGSTINEAAENGHVEVVRLLLQHGASMNGSSEINSPIAFAAQHGHLEVVQLLLQRGASPESALLGAIRGHNVDLARRLMYEDTSLAPYLLEKGKSVALLRVNEIEIWDPFPMSQENIIVEAARVGNSEIFTDLLECGARSYWCPERLFYVAASNGQLNIMNILEERYYISNNTREKSLQDARNYGYFIGLDQNLRSNCQSIDSIQKLKKAGKFIEAYESSLTISTASLEERENRVLLSRLHQSFYASYHELTSRMQNHVFLNNPDILKASLTNYRAVWKRGIHALKLLLRYELPTDVCDVIACLIVARSMQYANKMVGRSSWSDQYEQFLFEFDIQRWKVLVSEQDLRLFEEVALVVWPLQSTLFNSTRVIESSLRFSTIWTYPVNRVHPVQKRLFHLRDLVESLIGSTPKFELFRTSSTHKNLPLRQIQQSYGKSSDKKVHDETSAPLTTSGSAENTDLGSIKRRPPIHESLQSAPVPSTITLLFAGAIFGFIIMFLLMFQFAHLGLDLVKNSILNELPSDTIRRNCCLLEMYLGFYSIFAAKRRDKSVSAARFADYNFQQLDPVPLRQEFSDAPFDGFNPMRSEEVFNEMISIDDLFAWPMEGVIFPGLCPDTSLVTKQDGLEDTFTQSITAGSANDALEIPFVTASSDLTASNVSCNHCGKPFSTVTNRNKHERISCPKGPRQKFPCRLGPCKPLGSEDYRKRHERELCPYRAIF